MSDRATKELQRQVIETEERGRGGEGMREQQRPHAYALGGRERGVSVGYGC
jgi:hypothetical protein